MPSTNLVIGRVQVLREGITSVGIGMPVRPLGDRHNLWLGHLRIPLGLACEELCLSS